MDDYKSIINQLDQIKSFRGRIKYLNDNFNRIGSGSGRATYDIGNEKVLKLALNSKGIAQNDAEYDAGTDTYFSNVLASVYDGDDNNGTWIISQKAYKLTPNRFKELVGEPLKVFYEYIQYRIDWINGNESYYKPSDEVIERLDENEFAMNLVDFIVNYNLHVGDLSRISSYGEISENGHPEVILIDYGGTNDVINTHYSGKSRMYELYDFNDGNDDILSDIGNVGNEVRNGMWALVPEGVNVEEPDVNFNKFINNVSKYPKNDIENAIYLTEHYHITMNNFSNIIDSINDRKKFCKNFSKLQDYLYEYKYISEKNFRLFEVDEPALMSNIGAIIGGNFDIVEDGSALYSTDSGFGDINNPEYNNLDTSEPIENNLDANRSLYNENYAKIDGNFVDGWKSYNIIDNNNEIIGDLELTIKNRYVVINRIFINEEFRNFGYASDIMKNLIDYGDNNDLILALTPDSVWGGNKNKLVRWYKKLGFVENKGNNKDYTIRELYIKLPINYLNENGIVVNVKDKCKLGGGATCNKGDINNFKFKSIDENINSSDAENPLDSLRTIIDGRRDVGVIGFKYLNIKNIDNILQSNNLITIPIKQNGVDVDTRIVYANNPNAKNKAIKLKQIMDRNGGFLDDKSPEEAKEIGMLLGYSNTSIDDYINNKYVRSINEKEKLTLGDKEFDDLSKTVEEYIFNTLLNANKVGAFENNRNFANINETNYLGIMLETQMTLGSLPFKKEVEEIGGKIYSVGGAVRDEFLGKESKDLDLLITGVPMDKLEELLSGYGKVNTVGKSFGVIKFVPKGDTEEIDIAIPRTEKATGDGGHKGFDVNSDHTLPIKKDLERRDFTINAIAKNANGQYNDPFNGMSDLKNKIIRVVNPVAFSDDPLRMLRGVQFASRFGFTIEPKTMELIKKNASRISEIPSERILIEFDKIINKGNVGYGVKLLQSTGLFNEIFGFDVDLSNVNFDNVKTMGEFIYLMSSTIDSPSDFYLNRFSKEDAKRDKIYKEIKGLELAFGSINNDSLSNRSTAHNMYLISPETLNSNIIPENVKAGCNDLLSGVYPKVVNELAINGKDLMSIGLQGKQIGDTQKSLLVKIYADKLKNDRESLLSSLNGDNKPLNEDRDTKVEYGCLMLYMDYPKWGKITSVINKDDIYEVDGEFGIEDEPHITALYGFHDNVTADDVFELYSNEFEKKPIKCEIVGISMFETEQFDVVKFDINSEVMHDINSKMKELPHTSTYPNYHPHMTIAYVKKGNGKNYIKKFDNPITIIGDDLVYSTKSEKKSHLRLNEESKTINEGYGWERKTWNIGNGRSENIYYFTKKYDEWNNGAYENPSRSSVLEFLQNNFEDLSVDKDLNNELYWALIDREVLNEGKVSRYKDTKSKIEKSKSLSDEMKRKILELMSSGSDYHTGGVITSLTKPKISGKSFKGVSLGADKNGFFVYTHRARSKSYNTPNDIPDNKIKFIETTG